MTRRPALAILRAAVLQAAADLRPSILGAGLFSLLASTLPVILVGRFGKAAVEAHVAFGPMLVAGSVGALSGFITLQIAGETYNDRIGGALLRVRILPHGPMVWAIGKAASSIVQTTLVQVAVLVGALFFVDALDLSLAHALTCLPLIVLSAFSLAPVGFLAGSLVRGVYSTMLSYLLILALVVTSGAFFPLAALPRWLQVTQLALPTYWSGHLTRWALVADSSWEPGGAFTPFLAAGILAAWTTVGFALVPVIVRRSFRRESIGGLARMRNTLRSQSGL